MKNITFPKLVLSSSIALALAACGGSSDNDTDPSATPGAPTANAPDPQEVILLTAGNQLLAFNRTTPGTLGTPVTVTGLQQDETLLGIDFRPVDGLLYGVGSTGRLYVIDPASGFATVRSTLVADAADTTDAFTALSGTHFGVDFNPVADRLRIVGDSGQSLRINVDTGATTTDGAINGGAANAAVSASAYTNSFAAAGTTTLFAIDTVNDVLATQNPPNNGTLSMPVSLGVDADSVNGFDIDARTNTGYAVFNTGGARQLYRIDLAATANAATAVGTLAVTQDIRGMALRNPRPPMVLGLTDDGRLLGFKASTPNSVDSDVAVAGLAAGETLLGIDVRPKDGMLVGLSSAGRLFTIDPTTGSATLKATLVADAADTSAPYVGITGTGFAVDFNPVADRLRVISDSGQNLRINADTGAVTTDGVINSAGTTPTVSGAAYTNSFAGATATMLFDLDTAGDRLALQSPPNDGMLAYVGALGVDAAGDTAMDIGGGANGLILAALRPSAGGATSLYRVDLTTGAATLVNGAANPAASVVGSGAPVLRDIAIWLR